MLVSEIISVAGLVVTVITAVATSSCCAYFCKRTDKHTIDLLKERQLTLGSKIRDLKEKDNRGAVVDGELSSFIKGANDFCTQLSDSIVELERDIDERCMGDQLHNPWAQNRAQNCIETNLRELSHRIQKAEELSGKAVKGYVQPGEVAIVGEERSKAREDIWKLVSAPANDQAPGIGTICIHGVFGVGKTAIAKSIHNQALKGPDQQHFDSVIWVNVECGADVWQVQEAIAKSIECELPMRNNQASSHGERVGDDTRERAEKLRDALSRKGTFLLVLDSLWQPLSLDDIGIPELGIGRKLMVTSRIRTVCDDIIIKELFEIQPLADENEAWELFKAKMGSVLDLKPETVASVKTALVAEFDGIPLAISKLAKRLSNIQKHNPLDLDQAWREELDELASDQHRDPKLFDQWKDSYESLSKATRRCFLYCALFPKDHLIENRELTEYWTWEGLLGDSIETLDKAKKEGRKILRELVNAHLLQTGTGECVKMLSLVRLLALDPVVNRVFVRSGCSLTKLPLGHEWPAAAVERASFMLNKLDDLDLREKPNCSGLTTLLLQDNNSLVRSHEKFFSGMPELKVLDLSRTKISALPKSLANLTKLVALLLRNCTNLKVLPNLSNLQQVIVLDLSGTPLEHCPKGIEKMRKLRRLDLSQTKLATFPAKVVGQLIVLEELLMITDHDCVWGSSEDERWNSECACIEDLVKLAKLAVLQLHFQNAQAFDKYVNMAKEYTQVPPKFRFRVGEVQPGEAFEENSLAISGLSIDSGTLVNSTSDLSSSKLNLISLLKLRCLIVLDVCNFSRLTHLFSAEVVKSLTQLRELRVRSCEEMLEVVCQPDGEGAICFPQLTKMVFFELPRLKSICLNLDCPNLVLVGVWRCESLKLPKINSRSKEIRIKGENKWLKRHSRHSNPKFTFVDECVPLELITSATATDRKKLQGGGEKPIEVPKDWFWRWLGQGNNGEVAT